jgi:hypothetical protein
MDVIAVGSYGRGEAAKDVSDFEWITIYDDRYLAREEAIGRWRGRYEPNAHVSDAHPRGRAHADG